MIISSSIFTEVSDVLILEELTKATLTSIKVLAKWLYMDISSQIAQNQNPEKDKEIMKMKALDQLKEQKQVNNRILY